MKEDEHIKREDSDKYSLRGKVFQSLRKEILRGKYKEHDELREAKIAEDLGVSRTPVREALRQLELEGLITIIPNKGAYVNGITEKDVKDIYMIRSLLEGLCVRMAIEHMDHSQIDALEENVMLADFHAKKGNGEKLAELDNHFHEILYNASDSKILEHLLRDFHQYVAKVREINLSNNKRCLASNHEHTELVEAIKKHDSDLAEKLANQHILNAYQSMVKSKE